MYKAMTIAGSDSGAGAGIQADLKTFAALGVYGTSVVTAVTAQNTRSVLAVEQISPPVVAAQIDAIMEDIGADAAKTGMLGSQAIVMMVADRIRHHGIRNLVVDPVIVASAGTALLDSNGVAAVKSELLPLARVVTPNLPEAAALVGFDELRTDEDVRSAASAIHDMGAEAVIVTGGHRAGDADDVLFDGSRFQILHAPRIHTPHTHGTGCTFSAALAAGLARGLGLLDAARQAKQYVSAALEHAYAVGAGHSPLHHFYRLWPASGDSGD